MKDKRRNIIQLSISIFIIVNCIIYGLYIRDTIGFKLLSIGDLNPYGGWSEIKALFTDLSYRFRGISRSVALTISIGLVALLFGRFFCGFICPLGSLQDFSGYIGKKMGIRARRLPRGKIFKREILKYPLLIILLVLSIGGWGSFIGAYSPWTAYLNLFMGLSIQIGSLILLGLVIGSLLLKRVFCRYLCPLGAFQSLLYALGPLKIKRDEDCKNCSNCLRDCPVGIEESDGGIISPECVNCLKCTEKQCIRATSGYSLRFAGRKMDRNVYILASMILFFSIYLFLPILGPQASPVSIGELGELEDGIYEGLGDGFGGRIRVELLIEDREIRGIRTLEHRETQGYYEEVYKSISGQVIENQSLNVDGISGATSTTRGFLNAVKSALSQSIKKQ